MFNLDLREKGLGAEMYDFERVNAFCANKFPC